RPKLEDGGDAGKYARRILLPGDHPGPRRPPARHVHLEPPAHQVCGPRSSALGSMNEMNVWCNVPFSARAISRDRIIPLAKILTIFHDDKTCSLKKRYIPHGVARALNGFGD